ncbi:MAG TPA: hypothetical protein VHD76_12665 [Bryobacteraceae bacterium]|nr:hypothetical protein [Bryobacteraceae bacterium]
MKRMKTVGIPAALAIAMTAFTPAAALAANHGGRGGFEGRPAASHFNGGRGFAARPVAPQFNRGRAYVRPAAPVYRGGYGRPVYVGPRYRPGFSFGVGVGVYPAYGYPVPAYGYAVAPPACNPAGFYDQAGNWQYYQGCVPPPPNANQAYDAGGPPPNGDPNAGGPPPDGYQDYDNGGPEAPPQQ